LLGIEHPHDAARRAPTMYRLKMLFFDAVHESGWDAVDGSSTGT